MDQLASIPYEVVRDKTINTFDNLFKLIIIGDSCKSANIAMILLCSATVAVGKSCLLSRVMDEEFKVEH